MVSSNVYAEVWKLHAYEAEYLIFLNNLEVGSSRRTVDSDGDMVTSTHLVEPNAMAQIFGEKAYRQISQFHKTGTNVRMISTEIRGDDVDVSAAFDWDRNVIRFGDDKIEDIPNQPILDLESWLVFLQINAPETLNDQPFVILDRDRFREFRYSEVVPDIVEIDETKIDAWRIEMRRENRENEGFRVWVVAQYRALPVKFEKFKSDSSLLFRLNSLNWKN